MDTKQGELLMIGKSMLLWALSFVHLVYEFMERKNMSMVMNQFSKYPNMHYVNCSFGVATFTMGEYMLEDQ